MELIKYAKTRTGEENIIFQLPQLRYNIIMERNYLIRMLLIKYVKDTTRLIIAGALLK